MKNYEAISRFLAHERSGKPLFGLMGDANLAYLGHFIEQTDGRYIGMSIEDAVVLAADGYARFSGEVGMATVTFGPAITNAITALTEAARARTPLVLLTGDTPDVNEHYQRIDIAAVAALTGAAYERSYSGADAVKTIHKAVMRARARQQPVIVNIPYAQMNDEVDLPELPDLSQPASVLGADSERVEDALGYLMSARRPLVLAGRGVISAGARDSVLRFARMIGAPVMTSLIAKDLFRGEPENLGIHGTLSNEVGVEYMGDADVVIAFGASLNNWQTDHYHLMEGKKVIQVDSCAEALGKYGPVDVAIQADVAAAVDALAGTLLEADPDADSRPAPKYVAALKDRPQREALDDYRSTSREDHIDVRDAAMRISTAINHDGQKQINQVSDIGMYFPSVVQHMVVDPGKWDFGGYFGAIGLAIPLGVGAAYADSSRPTVVWVGDGAAMHSLMEVSTAVRDGLPLVVVVLNDSCYGAEFYKLENFGSKGETSFVQWPSFAAMARGMGAAGHTVSSLVELDSVLGELGEITSPTVIEVVTDPLERFRPKPRS